MAPAEEQQEVQQIVASLPQPWTWNLTQWCLAQADALDNDPVAYSRHCAYMNIALAMTARLNQQAGEGHPPSLSRAGVSYAFGQLVLVERSATTYRRPPPPPPPAPHRSPPPPSPPAFWRVSPPLRPPPPPAYGEEKAAESIPGAEEQSRRREYDTVPPPPRPALLWSDMAKSTDGNPTSTPRLWRKWWERLQPKTETPYFQRKETKTLKHLTRYGFDASIKWPTFRRKDTKGFPMFEPYLQPYLLHDSIGRPFLNQEHLFMTYHPRLEKDPQQFKQYMQDHGICIKCDDCYNEKNFKCNHDWPCKPCVDAGRVCTYTWAGIEGKDVNCFHGRRCEKVHTWAMGFFKWRAEFFGNYPDFSEARSNVDPCDEYKPPSKDSSKPPKVSSKPSVKHAVSSSQSAKPHGKEKQKQRPEKRPGKQQQVQSKKAADSLPKLERATFDFE